MRSLIIASVLFPVLVFAGLEFSGQLKPEDQKYYKNESAAGMNQLERIDSTVKEINKLYGEINSLKAEVANLKTEIETLKKKRVNEN